MNSHQVDEGGGWGSWWISHVVKVRVIGLELGLELWLGLGLRLGLGMGLVRVS